jgi:SAM-dependent methyltransferase
MNISKSIRKVKKFFFGNELQRFKQFHAFFNQRIGLEIGGPSQIFKSSDALPIYRLATKVDGCNFSTKTVWEGELKEGKNYVYEQNKESGYQFICEGNHLIGIKDNSYDFLLSSHSLEHFANPLKAVKEWLRVLKPDGTIVLVLPHKQFTFDRNRSITSFEHLKADFDQEMSEHDLTHLDEILDLHDYSLTPEIKDRNFYYERSLKNFENRCLHHHVFSVNLLKDIFSFFKIEYLYDDFYDPYHMIIMGKKNSI